MKDNSFEAYQELIKESSEDIILLPPGRFEDVFSGNTPQVLEAVEENEFDDLEELKQWIRKNLYNTDEMANEKMSLLVESGIIGHPSRIGDCDEGLVIDEESPVEIQGDVILSIGFSRDANHLYGLPDRENEE